MGDKFVILSPFTINLGDRWTCFTEQSHIFSYGKSKEEAIATGEEAARIYFKGLEQSPGLLENTTYIWEIKIYSSREDAEQDCKGEQVVLAF